jgi:hypothetical protein
MLSSERIFPSFTRGNRAYSRKLLLTVPFLRNALDFSFDSEMLLQVSHFGFRIAEVSARSRNFDDASSTSARAATVYGVKTLLACGRLLLRKTGVVHSRKFTP